MILYLIAYAVFVIAGSSMVKQGRLSRRAFNVVSVLMGLGLVVVTGLYIRRMP